MFSHLPCLHFYLPLSPTLFPFTLFVSSWLVCSLSSQALVSPVCSSGTRNLASAPAVMNSVSTFLTLPISMTPLHLKLGVQFIQVGNHETTKDLRWGQDYAGALVRETGQVQDMLLPLLMKLKRFRGGWVAFIWGAWNVKSDAVYWPPTEGLSMDGHIEPVSMLPDLKNGRIIVNRKISCIVKIKDTCMYSLCL